MPRLPEGCCFEGERDMVVVDGMMFAGHRSDDDLAAHEAISGILGREVCIPFACPTLGGGPSTRVCARLGDGSALFYPDAFDPAATQGRSRTQLTSAPSRGCERRPALGMQCAGHGPERGLAGWLPGDRRPPGGGWLPGPQHAARLLCPARSRAEGPGPQDRRLTRPLLAPTLARLPGPRNTTLTCIDTTTNTCSRPAEYTCNRTER